MDVLLGSYQPEQPTGRPKAITLTKGGKPAAVIRFDAKGNTTVSFTADAVPSVQVQSLKQAIEAFLATTAPGGEPFTTTPKKRQ